MMMMMMTTTVGGQIDKETFSHNNQLLTPHQLLKTNLNISSATCRSVVEFPFRETNFNYPFAQLKLTPGKIVHN